MLVIAICVLMESVGLSMALGTFVAGVLLADSEYRHELISDLEPFKGLLLGLFFIAVGMSVDFVVQQQQQGRGHHRHGDHHHQHGAGLGRKHMGGQRGGWRANCERPRMQRWPR